MAMLRNLIAGIRALVRRNQRNAEIQEELSSFQQASVEDKIRRGMTPEAAQRAARVEAGSAEAVREKVWSAGWESAADSLWQDLRYAVRMLARSPGFAAVAVLTLALGIGANAAIFSVINAVLLRPLQYPDPGQLLSMSETEPKAGVSGVGLSWPAFTALRESHRVFSAVAGLASHALTLTGHGEPADMSTIAVTPEFFSLLGTKPLLGRALSPADGERGAAPVVVMSEPLWRSRFGGDPGIVGTSITLDQRAFTVAGVMPASFQTPFVNQTDQLWIPLLQDPLFSAWTTRPPQTHWLPAIARLQSGVSPDQARVELEAMSAGLSSQFPAEAGWQIAIEPLHHAIVGDVEAPLVLLLGAVGLLLLIACANIANLLLARATSRSKEIAVRIALGANKRRIARQLLTESALLGLLGGAAGLFLAWWSVSTMASLLPAELTQLHSIHVDGSVLGFALALSLAASLIFGLAPVLHATRSDLHASFKEGSRGGEARGSQRARSVLAAAEVALAMVLLIGAGLLIRSFATLLSVSPGFQTQHRVKAEISLPRFQYSTPEQWAAFASQLMTRLQAKPGLQDSAIAAPLPILDTAVTLPFAIAGNPPKPQGAADTADYVAASPAYFRVMGISLVRGRLFSVDDSASTMPVAVISETLARLYFPHENPLGRELIFGFPPHGDVARQIVGVVADIHDVSLAGTPGPMMYVPFAQVPFWGGEVVVRSSLSTAEIAAAIRTETHHIDKDLPITDIESFPDAVHASMAEPRFRTVLLALFSAIALLLAAIGIFGVISFSVSRRTREIGVRIALGATPSSIRRLVIGESARLAAFGLAAGIPVALLLTHFLSALLFGVKPTDPLTFIGVALLLTLVALASAYLPARRAIRIDPMVALRCE
jgi:putative ABC transport system permease protein